MRFTYKNRFVLVEEIDFSVALVTLNDPPLNLNSSASLRELWETLEKLARDPGVRVLVLTGAGSRAFCAGSDLAECREAAGNPSSRTFMPEAAALNSLEVIDKPTICAIEGYCMGSGLELACCCDMRIVSERAVFSRPAITLGLDPAAGGRCRLCDVVGQARAMEMMNCSEPIDATEAYRVGLADRIVPAGATLISALDMADVMIGKTPEARRAVKEEPRSTQLHAPMDKPRAEPEHAGGVVDHGDVVDHAGSVVDHGGVVDHAGSPPASPDASRPGLFCWGE
jgi:enoyl-CoA hydratase/carnithine racemase